MTSFYIEGIRDVDDSADVLTIGCMFSIVNYVNFQTSIKFIVSDEIFEEFKKKNMPVFFLLCEVSFLRI